jgi:30S ribosomal protein S31
MVNVSGEIRSAGLGGSMTAGFTVGPVAARAELVPEVGAFPGILAAARGVDGAPEFGRPWQPMQRIKPAARTVSGTRRRPDISWLLPSKTRTCGENDKRQWRFHGNRIGLETQADYLKSTGIFLGSWLMGKGDRRSKRGKIFRGTYGKKRPKPQEERKKAKAAAAAAATPQS